MQSKKLTAFVLLCIATFVSASPVPPPPPPPPVHGLPPAPLRRSPGGDPKPPIKPSPVHHEHEARTSPEHHPDSHGSTPEPPVYIPGKPIEARELGKNESTVDDAHRPPVPGKNESTVDNAHRPPLPTNLTANGTGNYSLPDGPAPNGHGRPGDHEQNGGPGEHKRSAENNGPIPPNHGNPSLNGTREDSPPPNPGHKGIDGEKPNLDGRSTETHDPKIHDPNVHDVPITQDPRNKTSSPAHHERSVFGARSTGNEPPNRGPEPGKPKPHLPIGGA